MDSRTPSAEPEAIRDMFDRLASRYDLFNHLTSMGLATLWRRDALEVVRPGMRVLDLGCGTGDLSLGAARRLGGSGSVTGLDFSKAMIDLAEKRAARLVERPAPRFVVRRAEDLPVENEPYDVVVSGFVLRNLYKNIDPILAGVLRSLKPGGEISFLDITEPRSGMVRVPWRFYMNTVVALYGRLLFGKHYPEFYLTESAKRFPKADEFSDKLVAAGFRDVRRKSYLFGIVTLYRAKKSV